jgi:excinuclease UvrABC ATPase subunit
MNTLEDDIVLESKICAKCKESMPLNAFGTDSSNPDKLTRQCMSCIRKARNLNYLGHKEEWDARTKTWRNEHRTRINEIARKASKKGRIIRKELRDKIMSQFPCYICHEPRIACLEFHHLDPNTKEKHVGQSTSVSMLLKEASKCIVLCANCHKLLHNGDIQLPPNTIPMQDKLFIPI